MNLRAFVLAFALLGLAAPADTITLKDGRVIEGDVVEDDGKTIKIKMKKGALTVSRNDVLSIVEKLTPEQEYQERLKKLDAKSAAAHLDLGRWADAHELPAEAVQHFLEAWKLDAELGGIPDELAKHDYHLVDGVWQDADTYYAAKGYLKLDGRWLAPLEHAWRIKVKEVERLTEALKEAEDALKGVGSKAGKVEKLIEAEYAKIAAADKKIAAVNADLAKQNEKIAAAQKRADEASKALGNANDSKGEGAATGSDGKTKAAMAKLEAAKAAVLKENKAAEEIRKKLEPPKQEIADCKERIKALEADKGRAETGTDSQEAALKKAQEELDAAKTAAEAARLEWEKSK